MNKTYCFGLVLLVCSLLLMSSACRASNPQLPNLLPEDGTTRVGSVSVIAQTSTSTSSDVDPIKQAKLEQKEEIKLKFLEAGLDESISDVVLENDLASQEFVVLTDDSEKMSVEVPSAWTDVEFGTWVHEGNAIGTFIAASTDLAKFDQDLSVPGMFFGASTLLLDNATPSNVLKDEEKRLKELNVQCKTKKTIAYESVYLQGVYQPYSKCKNTPAHHYFTGLMQPSTKHYAALLRINAPNESSYGTVLAILNSVNVAGTPGIEAHDHDH